MTAQDTNHSQLSDEDFHNTFNKALVLLKKGIQQTRIHKFLQTASTQDNLLAVSGDILLNTFMHGSTKEVTTYSRVIECYWLGENVSSEFISSKLLEYATLSELDVESHVTYAGVSSTDDYMIFNLISHERKILVFRIMPWTNEIPLSKSVMNRTEGPFTFLGVTPNIAVANALMVTSSHSRKISNITSYFFQLYRMSLVSWNFFPRDVAKFFSEEGLGDFRYLFEYKDQLYAYYCSNKTVSEKFQFDIVYERVLKFIEPFIQNDLSDKTWSPTWLDWGQHTVQ